MGWPFSAPPCYNIHTQGKWKDHLPLLLLLGVLLAVAVTALTLWLVERCGFGRRPVLLRPGLRRPAVRELLPALSLLLLTAFWLLFRLDALPLEAYLRQSLLYGGLAGMLILLCLLLALKKGRRRGLAPTALLLLGADLLPGLGEEWAYLPRSKEFILAKPTLSDLYPGFTARSRSRWRRVWCWLCSACCWWC